MKVRRVMREREDKRVGEGEESMKEDRGEGEGGREVGVGRVGLKER